MQEKRKVSKSSTLLPLIVTAFAGANLFKMIYLMSGGEAFLSLDVAGSLFIAIGFMGLGLSQQLSLVKALKEEQIPESSEAPGQNHEKS